MNFSGTVQPETCCEKLFIEHLEPDYGFLFAMSSESHGYWVEKCDTKPILPELPDVSEVPLPAAMPLMLSGLVVLLLVRKRLL